MWRFSFLAVKHYVLGPQHVMGSPVKTLLNGIEEIHRPRGSQGLGGISSTFDEQIRHLRSGSQFLNGHYLSAKVYAERSTTFMVLTKEPASLGCYGGYWADFIRV